MLARIQALDTFLILFLQEHFRCAAFDPVMRLFTYLGTAGILWILVALILLCKKQYRILGMDVLIAIALCWCISELLLKNLIARPRPFLTIEELTVLVSRPTSYSFPSGHACSSFAASYVLTRGLPRRWSWVFYVAAVLICVSRIYVGVHYVGDVLAGMLVGTVFSALIYKARRRFFPFPPEKENKLLK